MFEIGSSLRDARVRQSLELTELEAETKIRAKYLRALEDERFDQLPGDTYVKGFLRIYAERLGLDGQLYVDEYNSRFSLAEEPVVATRPRRSRSGRFEAHAVLIALAGIVAVTVLVIAAWQIGTSDSGTPSTGPATTGAGRAQAPSTVDGQRASRAVPLVVKATRGRARVVVRARSGHGKLLYEGTVERGKSASVEGQSRLWVFLSRPRNVELVVGGRSLGSPSGPNKPSSFTVGAASFRRAR